MFWQRTLGHHKSSRLAIQAAASKCPPFSSLICCRVCKQHLTPAESNKCEFTPGKNTQHPPATANDATLTVTLAVVKGHKRLLVSHKAPVFATQAAASKCPPFSSLICCRICKQHLTLAESNKCEVVPTRKHTSHNLPRPQTRHRATSFFSDLSSSALIRQRPPRHYSSVTESPEVRSPKSRLQ